MNEKDPLPEVGSSPEWEALARHLAGELSPGEAAAVGRWLAEDPDRAELLARLTAPIERLRAAAPRDLDVEGALQRVHARMREEAGASAPVESSPSVGPAGAAVRGTQTSGRGAAPALRVVPGGAAGAPAPAGRRVPAWLGGSWQGAALRAAAAVVLLVGGALLARQFLGRGAEAPVAAAAARSWRTAIGQRDSVVLPDGSHVLLGPGSELTVAGNFNEQRQVRLSGEAFFRVRHDAARPFSVRVGEALVQDLGTDFDVRSEDGHRVRVVVLQGSVSVRAAGGALVLRAGDAARVEADGRLAAEPPADPAGELAWTRGELVFRGAPLSEVAGALRRWYGVELRIADPALEGRHLTTSFQGESRERVLEVIGLALGAPVRMHGDTAVLGGEGAGTH